MKNSIRKAVFDKNEIFIEEIEFITKQEVSVIGEIQTEFGMEKAQYVMDKRILHYLLKKSGKVGNEIIRLITDKFQLPHEVPVIVNLKEYFGYAICVSNCAVRLARSYYKDDFTGQWKVDYSTNLFFIEAVKPIAAVG